MSRIGTRTIAVCAALVALLAVGAASASAAIYVSPAPIAAAGHNCAKPSYNSVQVAIENAGGTTINVCPGTYTEQLKITAAAKLNAIGGAGTATVAMPAHPTAATDSCDLKVGSEDWDEISICTAAPETVSISGINVEAEIPLETCAGELNGIFVAGEATLKAGNLAIVGGGLSAGKASFDGCQHGVAVWVGSIEPTQIGHADLTKVNVSGYEKNGPSDFGVGSTLNISNSTITGEGPSPYIAQNGVQISFGAAGTVTKTTITGNENDLNSEQAAGVLFYGAGKGSKILSSTLSDNDMGTYYSSEGLAPAMLAEVAISNDKLESNRYEGVVLEEGKASLTSDEITGTGQVGIELIQNKNQTVPQNSRANKVTIEDQSVAAIKVTSDKSLFDPEGAFNFAGGTLSGNATELINESNNYTVHGA